jgi:hypothetical protein
VRQAEYLFQTLLIAPFVVSYEIKTMKTILTLFCVFFLTYSTSAQTSEITYEDVKLTDIGSISIPSIMELQSGVYKRLSDNFSKELGSDVSGVIIYQQAGLNDIFKTLKKPGTYARLMIKEESGKAGEYRRLDSKLAVTPSELKLLNTQSKNELKNQFQSSGIDMKLIRWDGLSVDKISGFDVLKTAYLRQLNDNPAVYVELYYIENYDRQYTLTISYREEDSSIWKDALNKTKNSFKITNIRKPATKRKR